jgi:competence protein ComEA
MFKKPAALVLALTLALPGWAFATTPVNINKADAATLERSLDGIGPSKAQAIIAWRNDHGPFKAVAELALVPGIGQATLKRNASAILLMGPTDGAPVTDDGQPAKSPDKSKVSATSSKTPPKPAAAPGGP